MDEVLDILDQLGDMPLADMPDELVEQVVAQIVTPDEDAVPSVPVAAFSSAI